MFVKLIRFTPDPDDLCGMAAALCYDSDNPERSLRGALKSGHGSVSEHATFTFYVEGVSRALLAQLTRHRIASFSVQSQRYVSMADCFEYVTPPAIKALGKLYESEYQKQMMQMHEWYCQWQEWLGGPKESSNEDARFVLPNATATKLIVTMNARELNHFFELRLCKRAQWEVRDLALNMLECCKAMAPELFKYAGPPCVRGVCPEGKRTCGKPWKRVGV